MRLTDVTIKNLHVFQEEIKPKKLEYKQLEIILRHFNLTNKTILDRTDWKIKFM